TASLSISGSFQRPDVAELSVAPDQLLWDQAFLALAIPDLRGVTETVQLRWASSSIPFQPGSRLERWPSGLQAPVAIPASGAAPFALEGSLRGSVAVAFAPVGVRNEIALRSVWPNPRFAGAFLPTTRTVGADGFTATWRISHYGRQLAQVGKDGPPPDAV